MLLNKKRILVVGDNHLMTAAISVVLGGQSSLSVCGVTREIRGTLEAVRCKKPDLLVVSFAYDSSNWLGLIKNVNERYPSTNVVVYSPFEIGLHDVERSVLLGVRGFVAPSSTVEQFLRTIRTVLNGGWSLGAEMESRFVMRTDGRPQLRNHDPIGRLSDREYEVLAFVGRGHPTRFIANQMNLSVKTVETYKERIKEKIRLPNAVALLRYAVARSRDSRVPAGRIGASLD